MFQAESFDPRSFSTYSWKMDGEIEPAKRSGVSRLWLIEYYTKEWEKNKKEKEQSAAVEVAEAIADKPKRKPRKAKPTRVPAEVEALVSKAEEDLDRLMQGAVDASAAQLFIFKLLNFTLDRPDPAPETDFLTIAAEYRDKLRREDEDLLLLAFAI